MSGDSKLWHLARKAGELHLGDRPLGPRIAGEEILDLEAARAAKRERWHRLHRFHLPVLRLLGFGLLSTGVLLYNRFFARLGPEGDVLALSFTLGAMTYAFLAWPLMTWGWQRIPGIDLVLLVADMPVMAAAVYATGGDESWLISVLLLRVVDQAPYGTRRALVFLGLVLLSFFGLVLWLDLGQGRPIDWSRELIKGVLLAAAGLYVALTARGSDLQRRRISRTMALARELIERLEHARDEARAASLAKGHFLANMSHEIRTPLNAVVGIADLLLEDDLRPAQRKRVELLQSSAKALLEVLGDVLDFSKIEADRLVLESRPIDLAALAQECRELFEPRAVERGVELALELDADLPRVLGDLGRLRQVLVNLLGNALKFTPEGRVVLRIRRLEGEPAGIRFEVEDTGVGIAAQALDNLFEPFTQVDASSSRRETGTGLGLAICQRLVEAMAGQIGVRSEEGVGSLFWIEISFEAASAQTPAREEAAELWPLEGRVLLVEDHPVNRLVAVAMVERLGLRVSVAENGRRALEVFEPGAFDLVLMDCHMPEVDGYAATRAIREREGEGERVPIVALTADALEETHRRCREAGMDDYLGKPLRLEALHDCLRRWLGRTGVEAGGRSRLRASRG